jgi:hypothetical protein
VAVNSFNFAPAPDRRMWSWLVRIADSLRLQNMRAEAHRMIAVIPPVTLSEEERKIFLCERANWSTFLKVIETEVRKRERLANAQSEFRPEIGDVVTALGQIGEFEITNVDATQRLVNLKLVEYEFRVDNVPWIVLKLASRAKTRNAS